MQHVDLLIRPQALLPMFDDSVVYDPLVAVKDGRIVYAGPASDAPEHYLSTETIDAPGSVVLPGLVNAHTHVGIHLFGTLCNDANLITALYQMLFPMEYHFDADVMYAASMLGLIDAVKGGVTTICDHYHFPESTARAAEAIGMRALVAGKIIEFRLEDAPAYDPVSMTYDMRYDRAEAERRLADNVAFIERWKGHDLVTPCLGPHAPDTLSTELLRECARVADDMDTKMLIHVAQSAAEVAQVRSKGYSGSIHYLNEIGFLSPRVQAAHMIFLDDEEVRIAADSGMGMSFNPVSNMWTHSFGPIDKLLASGANVGFGTDACSMDAIEEMRYALLATNHLKGGDHFLLTGYELLRMATIGGARCLGLGDEVGTIEVGKRADLIVLDLDDAQLIPNTNYHETVAYYAKSRNLTHTIIDGKVVFGGGRLTMIDESAAYAQGRAVAQQWLRLNRATLEARGVWPRIQEHFWL